MVNGGVDRATSAAIESPGQVSSASSAEPSMFIPPIERARGPSDKVMKRDIDALSMRPVMTFPPMINILLPNSKQVPATGYPNQSIHGPSGARSHSHLPPTLQGRKTVGGSSPEQGQGLF